MCSHCGSHDGVVEAALLTKYQTVLPMCQECQDAGSRLYCVRPLGDLTSILELLALPQDPIAGYGSINILLTGDTILRLMESST